MFYFLLEDEYQIYSLAELEKHIEVIKAMRARNAIHNPKFPFNFNYEEGTCFISAILFDGGMTSQLFPFYINNEESLVEKVINDQKHLREIK